LAQQAAAPVSSGAGGRAIGGLALVAIALIMLAGLGYLVWTNVLADRLARADKDGSAPLWVEGPSADKDNKTTEKGTALPAVGDKTVGDKKDTVESPIKDSGVTKKKDGKPPTDSSDDDVSNIKKPEKPDKPGPLTEVKSKPPDDDKKGPPPPVVEIKIEAPPIAPGVDAKKIDAAIALGVRYLKERQLENGAYGSDRFSLGYACLAGLALLECKVPPDDKSITRIAELVRGQAANLDDTYQASLAILFLDRLGEAKDRELIRGMALRVLLGQMDSGVWPYNFAKAGGQEMAQVDTYLKTHFPWSPARPRPNVLAKNDKKPPPANPKAPAIDLQNLPEAEVNWIKAMNRGVGVPILGFGDRSNTQFALLALWASRRHDVPAECPILLSYQGFRKSQSADGGWGYNVREPMVTNTMTCAGLLGLALGPGALPPGSNAGGGKLEDPAIQKGLNLLGGYVGNPSSDPDAKPPMQSLYFLWSVERVAVLFDLKTIGGKDWYGWGAQILLPNQFPDGHWSCGSLYNGANEHLDTCFALLFLKRANLVADLTESLRMNMVIRDPGAK
jgi:hypothetical protein